MATQSTRAPNEDARPEDAYAVSYEHFGGPARAWVDRQGYKTYYSASGRTRPHVNVWMPFGRVEAKEIARLWADPALRERLLALVAACDRYHARNPYQSINADVRDIPPGVRWQTGRGEDGEPIYGERETGWAFALDLRGVAIARGEGMGSELEAWDALIDCLRSVNATQKPAPAVVPVTTAAAVTAAPDQRPARRGLLGWLGGGR